MAQQEALDLIKRGCDELLLEGELKQKLELKRPLRIKAGFDPTAPICIWGIRYCSIKCASCRIWGITPCS